MPQAISQQRRRRWHQASSIHDVYHEQFPQQRPRHRTGVVLTARRRSARSPVRAQTERCSPSRGALPKVTRGSPAARAEAKIAVGEDEGVGEDEA